LNDDLIMNPHEIAALSSTELSTHFRQALAQQNVALALDLFTQVESRFQSYSASKEGSQQFVDEFLALDGSSEVRALHIDNRLQRCVARFEYLMELAGERARMQTSEETLHQIVESRERGRELIEVLGSAPMQGMIASELATKLGISPANLSPLIRLFNIHGIIDKKQMGKNVFLRLTVQGQALRKTIESTDMGTFTLMSSIRETDENLPPEQLLAISRELMLRVACGARDAVWDVQIRSDKAVAGIIRHTLDRLAEQYYQQDRKIAWWITTMADEFRKTISEWKKVA
jgi:DNA-binding transcriptional ArsR family regulator